MCGGALVVVCVQSMVGRVTCGSGHLARGLPGGRTKYSQLSGGYLTLVSRLG